VHARHQGALTKRYFNFGRIEEQRSSKEEKGGAAKYVRREEPGQK